MTNKYHCSKHGNIGHPECPECCANLKRLADDHNAIILGTKEDLEEMGLE